MLNIDYFLAKYFFYKNFVQMLSFMRHSSIVAYFQEKPKTTNGRYFYEILKHLMGVQNLYSCLTEELNKLIQALHSIW